VLNRGVTITR
jgi:hypothetical protein